MTPPAQQEYIITEDQLKLLTPDVADGMYISIKEQNQEKAVLAIRSHPAPSPDAISLLENILKEDDGAYFDTGIAEREWWIEQINCAITALQKQQQEHPCR